MRGEQLAQLAPGPRLRRSQLHQHGQLAGGFVDAPQLFQRPRAEPARGAPAGVRGAELLGRPQRRARVAAAEVLFGANQIRAVRSGQLGLGPVLAGPQALVCRYPIEQIGDAPLLRGGQVAGSQRLQLGSSLGRPAHRTEEVRAREVEPELRRLAGSLPQRPVHEREGVVREIPPARVFGEERSEGRVRGPAARIYCDGGAKLLLGLCVAA